jgi:hypothetical protein
LSCHSQPAAGGSSPARNPWIAIATLNGAKNVVPWFITPNGPVREARFKRNPDETNDGGVYDLFVITGRTFEAFLSAIPASEPGPVLTTDLVLHDNGRGEYTLDRMWIQGSEEGYEFLTPKSVTSRERLASVEVRAESTR